MEKIAIAAVLVAAAIVTPAMAQEEPYYCQDGSTATVVGDELRIKGGLRDGQVLRGSTSWWRFDADELDDGGYTPEGVGFWVDPIAAEPQEIACYHELPSAQD